MRVNVVEESAGTRHNAFRAALLLSVAYLAISVITLVTIAVLRDDPNAVTSAVWVRGTIVVASALLMVLVVRRASAGSAGAYRRARIISVVLVVAIAVIVAVPGAFPVWLRIEQAVCGLVLIGLVVALSRPALRSPAE